MEKMRRLLQGSSRDIIFSVIAAIVVVADQLTKVWIRSRLAFGELLWDKGWVQIVHVQNTGVSFGLFPGRIWLVITVVFLEMLVILAAVYMLRKKWRAYDSLLLRIGIGLIFGGAIGNQIDRIALGHVTDFIDFKWWPAFNVADASAVIGTIIVVVCIIFFSGLGKQKT